MIQGNANYYKALVISRITTTQTHTTFTQYRLLLLVGRLTDRSRSPASSRMKSQASRPASQAQGETGVVVDDVESVPEQPLSPVHVKTVCFTLLFYHFYIL